MVVSLLSNPRWALLACACLLLAPPRALAEAPAPTSTAAPVVAPVPEQPAAPAPAAPAVAAPGSDLPDPFAAEDTASAEPENLGWVLARTLLLLGTVLLSIYLTLNVGLRKLMGLQGPMGRRSQSLVSVVERVPLDQRRTLFVLKAADEYLLVGSGEGGLQLLSKLDTQAVDRIQAERPQPSNVVPLSPFLQKLLSRRTGSTPPRS